jgi:predicted class III extradiol MEMO1 family dioxygenase
MRNTYQPGDWNVHCDVCSRKIKASESKKRWDGLIVCSDDFEHRHPQDFVRAKQDKISVAFVRKENTTQGVLDYTHTINGSTLNSKTMN